MNEGRDPRNILYIIVSFVNKNQHQLGKTPTAFTIFWMVTTVI